MDTSWKDVKEVIDSLPTTDKTIVLKRTARLFDKGLKEWHDECKPCSGCEYTKDCILKEILGDEKKDESMYKM